MPDTLSNDKRIARNTMMLYIRMIASMLVSLYTSRIVLQVLGETDFGVYGVVGGVVAMFGFLNTSMAGATSRFLTYELGRGDKDRLSRTFSIAFFEHLAIALLVLIICETFGVWFLNNKLVIPPERLPAANWVLQLSILSMVISVTQVPYNSSIIAHEKMDVYAYVELANVFLRLGIVFLLKFILFDKLILYAILSLSVSVIIAFTYRLYCVRQFQECRLHLVWDVPLLKSMLSFSGWDLYGNMSVMARTQGVNMLVNLFFGPIANAAASITTSVQGAVMGFANNVLTAVKPQIIKYYAQKEIDDMLRLVSNAVRLNSLILMLLSVPLIVEMNYVIRIWLGEVPMYVIEFCILTLLFNQFSNVSSVLVTGVHATGKIIRPSLINGTLYLLVVPFTYFAFKQGAAAWMPYLFNLLAVILGMLSNAYTLHLYIPQFSVRKFIFRDMLPCILAFVAAFAVCMLIRGVMAESLGRLVTVVFTSSAILLGIGYFFLIPKQLSRRIIDRISSFVHAKS